MKIIRLLIVFCLLMASAVFAADPIDINSATVQELETVKGIGPIKAQRIIDYRTQNGPFKSVDDLNAVKGIGDKSLEKIRPQVTAGGGTAAPATPAATDTAAPEDSMAKPKGRTKRAKKAADDAMDTATEPAKAVEDTGDAAKSATRKAGKKALDSMTPTAPSMTPPSAPGVPANPLR
jgi:competence protein ComEA